MLNLPALVALGAALLLASCATRPPIPAETTSAFVLERDLLGQTIARGEFRAINGVRRPFTARLNGTLEGDVFVLVEDFEFDDGERDRKTWRLRRVADGRYVGTREDVVGEAVAFQDGLAFRLEYDVRLPGADGRPGRKVRFRDVLVRTEQGVLNRATVGLFGLRVARVELLISPGQPASASPAASLGSTTRQLTNVYAP